MTPAESIRKYGAKAVYDASARHMSGDRAHGLSTVELNAESMADVYEIQSAAYAELGDAAKAIDYAMACASLSRLPD